MSNETVCWWLVTTCVKAQLYFVFYFSIGKETVDPHQQHLHAKSMFSIELLWMRRYKLRVRGLVKWQTIQFLWSWITSSTIMTCWHIIYIGWNVCYRIVCCHNALSTYLFTPLGIWWWSRGTHSNLPHRLGIVNQWIFIFFFFFSIDIWIMMYIDEFGEIIQNATRSFSR